MIHMHVKPFLPLTNGCSPTKRPVSMAIVIVADVTRQRLIPFLPWPTVENVNILEYKPVKSPQEVRDVALKYEPGRITLIEYL